MVLKFKLLFSKRDAHPGWRLTLMVFLLACSSATAANGVKAPSGNDNTTNREEPTKNENWGLWPQLSVLLKLPEDYQLRHPGISGPPEEWAVYDRVFPLFAQQAIDRGFALPRPWGISLIGVSNEQGQDVSNVAVALGKGMAPPPDSDLVDLPFVGINNVVSNTDTYQIKGDLWLLPNLNAFLALGKITGNVNLDVDIDLDAWLPPPVCRPMDPCGVKRLNFDARVDAQTVTAGVTAVHGFDNWYLSATLSRSVTISNKEASNVRAISGGLRVGRRWLYGRGNLLSPYVGAAYLDLDETITGVTRAPETFPDGETLEVRYRAKLKNQDQWSGVLGLNIGLLNGLSFQGEYNWSSNSERFQLSTTYRF